MDKNLTFDEIEFIYSRLAKVWDESLKDLHLSNKSVYNLIYLKKSIENKHNIIQETVAAIMRSHGAEENERGMLVVPPENVKETNKELSDLAKNIETINCNEIFVREEDKFPTALMEILYEFLTIE